MSELFTPPVLEHLKKTIDKTLSDTINFMFNFDICLRDFPEEHPRLQPVQASVALTAPRTSAILCITIPSSIAKELVSILGGGGEDIPAEQMPQDIACELANIIAHAVQGYFARPPADLMFEVGLPAPGLVKSNIAVEDAGIVRLPFPPHRENTLILDFIFKKSA